jgi:CheY-like chemotaxis protein
LDAAPVTKSAPAPAAAAPVQISAPAPQAPRPVLSVRPAAAPAARPLRGRPEQRDFPLSLEMEEAPACVTLPLLAPRGGGRRADPGGKLRLSVALAGASASGRRLVRRRLGGLPHKFLEAGRSEEILKACAKAEVGLLIMDSELPPSFLRAALQKAAAAAEARGLEPPPSICLLTHEAQAVRMLRLGFTECQVKSAGRESLRQSVLRLCPHPEANSEDLPPESPGRAVITKSPEKFSSDRVPMLDLIVASLDAAAETPESGGAESQASSGPEAERTGVGRSEKKHKLAEGDEYMDAVMLPLVPDFLVVLEESLDDLDKAMRDGDLDFLAEISSRMLGQGTAFGLERLERLSRCVEMAARAGDAEAARDLGDELQRLGRNYMLTLRLTYERRPDGAL